MEVIAYILTGAVVFAVLCWFSTWVRNTRIEMGELPSDKGDERRKK